MRLLLTTIRSSHCFVLFLGGAGVNDHGALGMDTGGLVDMKDGDDSDNDSGSGLNPKESTPTEVTPLKSHVSASYNASLKGVDILLYVPR